MWVVGSVGQFRRQILHSQYSRSFERQRARGSTEAEFDDMASVAALAAPSDCVLRGGCNGQRVVAVASNQSGVALPSAFLHRSGLPQRIVTARRQSMRSTSSRSRSFVVLAAKLPAGVEAPVEEPKLPVSLWGFTEKAEVWNSRAAMIGIFALVALEFFTHQGILQMIGVDVGKGLNIPL